MHYTTLTYHGAEVAMAMFDRGRREIHAIIRSTLPGRPFTAQLEAVADAAARIESPAMRPVYKRYWLSDAANQAPLLPADEPCAVTVVQQPPLDGTKITLWIILEDGADFSSVASAEGTWADSRGRIWTGDTPTTAATSDCMTATYLDRLDSTLSGFGASLRDNCVRTWLFVRDVDVNYAGVVAGRNSQFARCGLTPQTHFIASTGIEGRTADTASTVAFAALSDTRLAPGQMQYIYGASHLNPTSEYGVAFERGTMVDYADRRHVYISGTASIDNKGRILHPGDITAQCARMLENIGVLLAEARCGWADTAHMIVYLRDTADYHTVAGIFARILPDVPTVILLAPVCRPGWLVETECMAVKEISDPRYVAF